MSGGVNVLMGQQFKHMADSEVAAQNIVEQYKSQYTVKKSNIMRKSKKGVEYFVVTVEVSHVAEKEAFEIHFGE